MNTENQPELRKAREAGINELSERIAVILKQRSAGEYDTWGFVAMFLEIVEQAKNELSVGARSSSDATGAQPLGEKEAIIKAIQGLLSHAGIADQHAEDIDAQDHAAESFARKVLRDLEGKEA